MNERHIYKVEGIKPGSLTPKQTFVLGCYTLLDSFIMIFTLGHYSGRMNMNYIWKQFKVNTDKLKAERLKENS